MNELLLVHEASLEPASAASVVARLARGLYELSNAERDTLQRINPTAPSATAIAVTARALVRAGAEIENWPTERLRCWTILLRLMVLMAGGRAGRGLLHRRGVPFGAMLNAAGYGELRFLRLMDARGRSLDDLLTRAVRFLVHRAVKSLDFVAIAPLVLDPDCRQAERARVRFAKEFFTAEAARTKGD